MDMTIKTPEMPPLGQKAPAEPKSGAEAGFGAVLGPDGEAARIQKEAAGFLNDAGDRGRELGHKAEEAWSGISSTVGGFVEREPMRGALTAFGVGMMIGVVLGVIVTR
ncbi:MAG: hypothetical protein ABI682_13800, partial [Acidobacteriota bacterium]